LWLGFFAVCALFSASFFLPRQAAQSAEPTKACDIDKAPYDFPLMPHAPNPQPPALPDWRRGSIRPFFRGMSLGLYFQDQADDYEGFLVDIAKTGASHVGFIVSWYQENVRSTEIGRHPTKTVDDARLIRTIMQARKHGLGVFLLPIVRLKQRGPEDWRGVIKPTDLNAWWRSYRAYILHYAQLSQRYGVELFSVGSELVSMEKRRSRWIRLIRAIRQLYQGNLIYSANWDHYEPVTFWDQVDFIGISNYYELSKDINPPVAQLKATWEGIRQKIERWKMRYPHQPLLFTEVGYYSQEGTNIYPWDYTRNQPLSLEEQRRCYQAFTEVWSASNVLHGAFFWNWFAPGGEKDTTYTPRGKPAECIVRGWFSKLKARDSERQKNQSRWLRRHYLQQPSK
jgi:hypothetical protein